MEHSSPSGLLAPLVIEGKEEGRPVRVFRDIYEEIRMRGVHPPRRIECRRGGAPESVSSGGGAVSSAIPASFDATAIFSIQDQG